MRYQVVTLNLILVFKVVQCLVSADGNSGTSVVCDIDFDDGEAFTGVEMGAVS